jgi:hypothetical protein
VATHEHRSPRGKTPFGGESVAAGVSNRQVREFAQRNQREGQGRAVREDGSREVRREEVAAATISSQTPTALYIGAFFRWTACRLLNDVDRVTGPVLQRGAITVCSRVSNWSFAVASPVPNAISVFA